MWLIANTVVPVFSIVALGYLLGGRRVTDARSVANLCLLVASPALLFTLLGDADIDLSRMGRLAAGASCVALGTGLLAWCYRGTSGVGRGFALPCVFWNAGNMGLACARLAFGEEGLEAAAVLFVTISLHNSVFGIWIAKGESGLGEALRMPLLYGAAGGLALAVWDLRLPRLIMEPIEMLGATAIPLMLLTLGLQLRGLRVRDAGHAGAAVAIRMLGGLACAAIFVALFGVTGVDRQVLLLIGALPPAVMNAAMAERYATDQTLVASAIMLGTLCSIVTIPLVLLFIA